MKSRTEDYFPYSALFCSWILLVVVWFGFGLHTLDCWRKIISYELSIWIHRSNTWSDVLQCKKSKTRESRILCPKIKFIILQNFLIQFLFWPLRFTRLKIIHRKNKLFFHFFTLHTKEPMITKIICEYEQRDNQGWNGEWGCKKKYDNK